MKITERDMDHPLFWRLKGSAKRAVHASLNERFLDTMNDREAKAVHDAVEALTKAMLIQSIREREEIA